VARHLAGGTADYKDIPLVQFCFFQQLLYRAARLYRYLSKHPIYALLSAHCGDFSFAFYVIMIPQKLCFCGIIVQLRRLPRKGEAKGREKDIITALGLLYHKAEQNIVFICNKAERKNSRSALQGETRYTSYSIWALASSRNFSEETMLIS
jgi:hypothetical protein